MENGTKERTEKQKEEDVKNERKEQTEEQRNGIEERTKRLVALGCHEELAGVAASVAEMYLTCLLAAKDVLEDKRLLEGIVYMPVTSVRDAADAIIGKISVSFARQSMGGIVAGFDPRNMPSINQMIQPPDYPRRG